MKLTIVDGGQGSDANESEIETLFVTAAQMLLDLAAQESARALEHRLRYYSRPRLLWFRQLLRILASQSRDLRITRGLLKL